MIDLLLLLLVPTLFPLVPTSFTLRTLAYLINPQLRGCGSCLLSSAACEVAQHSCKTSKEGPRIDERTCALGRGRLSSIVQLRPRQSVSRSCKLMTTLPYTQLASFQDLSIAQRKVVDLAMTGAHLVVRSGPGSGKTRVAIAVAQALATPSPGAWPKRILMTAFTRAGRDELDSRVNALSGNTGNAAIDVRTIHQLGYATLAASRERYRLDDEAGSLVTRTLRDRALWGGRRSRDDEFAAAVFGVGRAKAMWHHGVTDVTWRSAVQQVLQLEGHVASPRVLDAIMGAVARAGASQLIDFDDQVYLAARSEARPLAYDVVIVDEAADVTPAQTALLLKFVKSDGQLIAIGDPLQAIFQFAGANADIMHFAIDQLGAAQMELGESFRCARNIIEYVVQAVPEASFLRATKGAIAGSVTSISSCDMQLQLRSGDLVLGRTLASLLHVYHAARAAGLAVVIFNAALLRKVEAIVADELASAERAQRTFSVPRALAAITADNREVGEILSHALSHAATKRTLQVEDILMHARLLFTEQPSPDRVVLSTVHKKKGHEASRVLVLHDSFYRADGDVLEEQCIYYVACTRAKHELVIVRDDAMTSWLACRESR